MKHILIGILILSFLTNCNVKSQKKEQEMISLEKIEEMYSNMKANGIDTDADFLYEYWFISKEKKLLEKALPALEAMSFRFVSVEQAEDNQWWLNVDRIESHSAQTLFDLNTKLYAIADKYKIEYDGFNLSNPDPKKGIEKDTYTVPEDFKWTDFMDDGFPVLLVVNSAFDQFPHKEEFKYLIKITTLYEHDTQSMLPVNKGLEELSDFEYFIENNFTQNGIKNYYLMRITHKGIRTFYVATSDKIGTTQILNMIKQQSKKRAFDFEVIEDKAWKTYTNLRNKLPKE
jgi:regulator of RNase E activity RraB